MPKRKICVVTGTRADYGLLYWLLREIDADPDLHLQLAVTGMHLAPEFGETAQTIEADGFPVSARIETLLSSDTSVGTAKSMGLGLIGFADALERLGPDLVVVIGDRFEMWAAAQAAFVGQRVLAHIHGGETTEGAFDEGIRHSLTKLSHYHFVAAETYRNRVIQMGEEPDRVFTVGAPGLDHVLRTPLLDRNALATSLDMPLDRPLFAVTLHPATLETVDANEMTGALIEALAAFPQASIVVTEANADPQGRSINRRMRSLSKSRRNVKVFPSLGQKRYLSLVREADAVIGNSSSGILEAPVLRTPTVNIGSRQKGRLRAASVVDCSAEPDSIARAIRTVLSDSFQDSWPSTLSVYGEGGAAETMKEQLKVLPMDDSVLRKSFYDVDVSAAIYG
jgi:UDP-N-acetylglucosamine 2-epimerase (non-hydrolysing)/GDP/UDP-N,N'-diacetylbacillosamine 2-epimerase (hydrolysing)